MDNNAKKDYLYVLLSGLKLYRSLMKILKKTTMKTVMKDDML